MNLAKRTNRAQPGPDTAPDSNLSVSSDPSLIYRPVNRIRLLQLLCSEVPDNVENTELPEVRSTLPLLQVPPFGEPQISTPRSILFSQPLRECELLARDDDEEEGR